MAKIMHRVLNRNVAFCALLTLITAGVYYHVLSCDFINLDDELYVTKNEITLKGLTPEGFKWAFELSDSPESPRPYWHPLTNLSHMLDIQLYGLKPGLHHLNNLILHILNSLILFALMYCLTHSFWQAAVVSLLFAVHPVNVESVAWIASRKSLLSAFFMLLTVLMYVLYVQKSKPVYYILSLLIFVLGLLTKPMLVTLPCVLLLLDFYPLKRAPFNRLWMSDQSFSEPRTGNLNRIFKDLMRLLGDKVLFFILTGISIKISTLSLAGMHRFISFANIPMTNRISNAIISYFKYLYIMVWPENLAIFYPFPESFATWKVAVCAIGLVLIFIVAFISIKKRPYVTVGWLWYFGILVPVSGLSQVGVWPSYADRWAYLPLIGIFWIIAAFSQEICLKYHQLKKICIACGVIILVILSCLTVRQVYFWTNSHTLFAHALKVTKNSFIAHLNMGLDLKEKHQNEAALEHFKKTLELEPEYIDVYKLTGILLSDMGRLDQALYYFRTAANLQPDNISLQYNYANALVKKKLYAQAAAAYRHVLRLDSDYLLARINLGNTYLNMGRLDEAIRSYKKALKLDPQNDQASQNLKAARNIKDQVNPAIDQLKKSLDSDPKNPVLHYKLAELYVKRHSNDLAITQFEKVVALDHTFFQAYFNLAVLYSDDGEYDQAILNLKKMIELRPNYSGAYYNIACMYARQSNAQKAVMWIDKAVDKGYSDWKKIKTDPDLDLIRNSKPFKDMIEGK